MASPDTDIFAILGLGPTAKTDEQAEAPTHGSSMAGSWSLGSFDTGEVAPIAPAVSAPAIAAMAPPPAMPAPVTPAAAMPAPSAVGGAVPPAASAPLTRRQARMQENGAAASAAPAASVVSGSDWDTLLSTAREGSAPSFFAEQSTTQPVGTLKGRAPRLPRAQRKSRGPQPRVTFSVASTRRRASKAFSFLALLIVGAFVVSTTTPTSIFADPSSYAASTPAGYRQADTQTLAVSDQADDPSAQRDAFNVVSFAELQRLEYGNSIYTFTPTFGAVRWPFPYSVTISSGWGARVAPCLGCSTFHKGLDFTPGEGNPIQVIADGVVTSHTDETYGFGNCVIIQHTINGQMVESLYAHMQHGSSPLKVGDHVSVGDFVGLVGSTGSSTGAHLHFEVHPDGVAVDPFKWLTANATNKS
ncbi:MAG: M23 family metallopeptidase [Salinibacterium sp.]|nr:MAG: M23 family metallopeptidase [Salinibacterium sp.]